MSPTVALATDNAAALWKTHGSAASTWRTYRAAVSASTSRAVARPQPGVEQLHLDGRPCTPPPRPVRRHSRMSIAAVADLAAPVQHALRQRRHPVRELEGVDTAAAPARAICAGAVVVPPDVVRVHHDAHLSGREALRQVEGLRRAWRPRSGPRRTSGAAARSPAVRPAPPRTAPDSPSASAMRSRAPGRSRLPAGRPPETRTSVSVPSVAASSTARAVVVQGPGALVRVDGGEEAAAAQGRDGQPRVPDQLGRRLQAVLPATGLAPQAHARDAELAAGVGQFGQRQLLDRHLVDGEAGQVAGGAGLTGATPYRRAAGSSYAPPPARVGEQAQPVGEFVGARQMRQRAGRLRARRPS